MKRRLLSLLMALTTVALLTVGILPAGVAADAAGTVDLVVGETPYDGFSIRYLSTAAETEIRPYVLGNDLFAMGRTVCGVLSGYMLKATGKVGAMRPVNDESELTGEKEIQVLLDTAIPGDAFRIAVRDACVTIRGGTLKGLWYGVYDFLERVMGYRFFTESVIVRDNGFVDEGVASVSGGTITAKEAQWEDEPGFAYRSIRGAWFGDTAEAAGRDESTHSYVANYNKVKIQANLASRQNGGDDDKWGVAYPQYGGMKGTVMSHAHAFEYLLQGTDLRGADGGSQPCMTDRATYEATLKGLMDLIEWEYSETGFPIQHTDGVNIDQISVGWNDNTNYCTCADCRAKIAEMGSLTDVYIDFVNRLAAEVAKVYPNIRLMALAYNITTDPPTSVRPAENVDIMYCSPACNSHSLWDVMHGDADCAGPASVGGQDHSQAKNLQNLRGWLALTPHVYAWEYMDNFSCYIAPAAFYRYLYGEFRALHELGVKGIYAETSANHVEARYGFQDLRDYLMGKMLWDPEMSEEEFERHAREFIAWNYAGTSDIRSKAVDDIMEFMQHYEDAAVSENPGCWMNNYSSIKADFNLDYYGEHGDDWQKPLDEAYELSGSEEGRTRIGYLRLINRYLTLSGRYLKEYANGTEASRAAYVEEYKALYGEASHLPTVFLDYYIDWIYQDDTYKSPDTVYTTGDGVDISYCPLAWYNRRDGFFDLDPRYYQVAYVMNDGTPDVFAYERVSNFYAVGIREVPVREGYLFKGWFVNMALTEPFRTGLFGTKVSGGNTYEGLFTVYAGWEPDPSYVPPVPPETDPPETGGPETDKPAGGDDRVSGGMPVWVAVLTGIAGLGAGFGLGALVKRRQK